MSIDDLSYINIFVFSGHGPQNNRMTKELYKTNEFFQKSIDSIDLEFQKYFGYSIIQKLWSLNESNENDMKLICDPMIAQCSLFIVQVSIFNYLKSININPSILIGHSFSEFFIFHLCDLISLEDSCYLTYTITKLQEEKTDYGKMLAVNLTQNEFNENYKNHFKKLEIVCYNSKSSLVIGGTEDDINQLSIVLKNDNVFNVLIQSNRVFHSSNQEAIKNDILNLNKIKTNKSSIKYPVFSTYSGELINFSDDEFNLNQYLYNNIREPVQFYKTIKSIYKYCHENQLNSNLNFIEISPNPTLLYYLKNDIKPSKTIIHYFNSIKFHSTIKKSNETNDLNELNNLNKKLQSISLCDNNKIELNFDNNKLKELKSINSIEENEILEKLLVKISSLLKIKEFKLLNIDLGLIEYGMDSLLIVQLKSFIEKEFQCLNIFTINLLQKSNIIEIFYLIKLNINSNNQINYNLNFWENEIKLDSSIRPNQCQTNLNYKSDKLNILLTGSTGYIGAYLLCKLIKLNKCKKVYCLVRKKTQQTNPIESIINNLKTHHLYDLLNGEELNKIKPVIGDMSKKSFELNDETYIKLSNKINLILNSGANVSFSSEYFDNKEVNVGGILEILKFSCSGKQLKRIVHLSTMTVFVNDSNINDKFDESYFPDLKQINKLNGYMQSKVVSEYLLLEASTNRSIPCQLIRPPFVFSNPQSGIGNTNDYLQLILQACVALNAYPSGFKDCYFFQVPITWLVDSIINLMLDNNDQKQSTLSSWKENTLNCFNLTGDTISLNQYFKILKQKYSIKKVNYQEWVEMLVNSKNMSCIRIKTFHSLDLTQFKIDKYLNISSSTIQLLESLNLNNNQQYNDTLNQYNVTPQMIYNHINYIFKK